MIIVNIITLYIPMMSNWEKLQTLHRMPMYTVSNKYYIMITSLRSCDMTNREDGESDS